MDELVQTALHAADAATAVHRAHAGRVAVDGASEKGRSDFVSRVDLEAQGAALEVIRSRHPGHRILAEEDPGEDDPLLVADTADADAVAGPLWVVDPLDGTTNFLAGHPMYAASVAVVVDGRPEAGAVVCGPTSERWWAARGRGAFKGGRPIEVSGVGRLPHALVGTGFPFKLMEEVDRYGSQLARVLRASAGVRRGGSAALDLCYLAQGTFDAFWELFLNPWDVAAGLVIVREAGGVVTRLDGEEPGLGPGSILAANGPGLHEALARTLDGG